MSLLSGVLKQVSKKIMVESGIPCRLEYRELGTQTNGIRLRNWNYHIKLYIKTQD